MSGAPCDTCAMPLDGDRQGDVVFCTGRPAHPNIRPLADTPTPINAHPTRQAAAPRHTTKNGHATKPAASAAGQQPSIIAAVELAAMQFRDPKVIVERLLVEGAQLLVAPGKSGKSRLAWAINGAVAAGGVALGSIPVEGGDVLYLSLEDGKRRSRERMLQASNGHPPERLYLATDWPKLDAGGLALLEGWLQAHPSARLVTVDTLKRVRPHASGQRNAYDVDYEAAAPLNDLALKYGVCILVLHHTNKVKATEDPTDKISGSTGLLAAVDGCIVLERVRGKADAILGVYHRDMEDARYALKNDPDLGWRWLGDAAEYSRTELQDAIVAAILDAGRPLKPADVATSLDRSREGVRQRMWQMAQPNAAGGQLLVQIQGHYWPATRPIPEGETHDP